MIKDITFMRSFAIANTTRECCVVLKLMQLNT